MKRQRSRGYDECVGHELDVSVNDIGRAFITLEGFYRDGAEVKQVESDPE